jgi:hypothetical protein
VHDRERTDHLTHRFKLDEMPQACQTFCKAAGRTALKVSIEA